MFEVGAAVRRTGPTLLQLGVHQGCVYTVEKVLAETGEIRLAGVSRPIGAELFEPALAAGAAGVVGRKDDSGKLDMTLLDDMPRALQAITEVMQWAITKKEPVPYVRGSWLGVHPDRYRAAIIRHYLGACGYPKMVEPRFRQDSETKLLHLAHLACSAMMALENTLIELENNNGV